MANHRVVITGMGIVSPLGSDVNEAYQNAIAGNSGIVVLEGMETNVKIGAPVKGFDPLKHQNKMAQRRQDLFSQYAIFAAKEAFIDAKLEGQVDPEDMGVLIGTGMGGMQTFARDLNKAFEGGYGKIPPMFIPMIIPNMAAGNVAIALNAKGHCSCVTTACAAATNAIGDAYRMIKYGDAKVMISGGSEAGINPYSLAGFDAITALSKTEDPNQASRPFDKERNGFILGEGAGILVLESLDHAQARGAHIYAEITGYGSTCDAYHITAPSGEGAVRAMQQALKEAKLVPSDIDYINAHGTSTPLNDAFETKAIKEVFQDDAYKVSISSTKSMHGHALGATGGIEAILSIKTINEGIIPPTINLNNPDPECDLDYTANVAKTKTVDIAMSNSLAFGGHNAILVFRKYGV